jgi:CRP/FNR family cyclic AMP-dependent transcriptional regulator
VHLFAAEPDLLAGLGAEAAAEARSAVVAPVETIDRGTWSPEADAFGSRSGFGLLMLEGFLARHVALGERSCAELLGEGNVLHPWVNDGEFAVAPFSSTFSVLEPVRVAVLERAVADALCRWPEVVANLMRRVMERSRYLAGHLTLTHFPRVETRLLVLMWHLGERFGKMTPEGVVVRLPLSHELIGRMIAARRPSVTTALGQLHDEGLVFARGRQEWVLKGDPPPEVQPVGAALELSD